MQSALLVSSLQKPLPTNATLSQSGTKKENGFIRTDLKRDIHFQSVFMKPYSFLVPDCDNVALVGNGFCNDETNNADCNYDGGECCGPDISCK